MVVRRPVRCVIHVVSLLALAPCLGGCPTTPPGLPGPELGSDDGATTADSTTTGDGTSSAGSDETSADDAGTGGTTGTATDETSGGGEDGPGDACGSSPSMCTRPSTYDGPGECDPFAQDCPAGEKCMPIMTNGTWDGTSCRPVQDRLAQPGDPCVIEGGVGSGLDNCDVGAMCWPSAGGRSGTCVSLCGCGPAAPTCDSPDLTCAQLGAGVLPLCLPSCDPLAQNCVAGEGCFPTEDGTHFVCVPAPMSTSPGDPCAAANACSTGQICVGSNAVPGCADPVGCCAALCNVGDPNGGCMPGQACVAWWPDAPPANCPADLGVCLAPM